jgi:multiple sugar transport system permease protein
MSSLANMVTEIKERQRTRLGLRTRYSIWGYLFLIPTLAILLIFRIIPMIEAAYYSFTSYDLFSPPRFVGFKNYIDLLGDPVFLQSAKVSALYVVGSVIPVWIISLAMAKLVLSVTRFRGLFRGIIFMPVIMSMVVVAVLWRFLYYFPSGMVNTFLGFFGVSPLPWLSTPNMALLSIILIAIWRASPYFMIIFTAGLQAIPESYYEAGKIDGTNAWTEFWYITLPLLRPTILLVVVMSVIVALKVFAVPQIMTNGGPAGGTNVVPLQIYKTGFEFFKMGKASAMSMFLFAVMMVFSIFQIRLFSSEDETN